MNWREFRRQQRVASVANRFISYIDQGHGEPVILLHGIPTWGYLFHPILAELTETHRVLVPDLPGFGFSDKSDRFDRSIARQAEMIVEWMDKLKLSAAAVVGHDIGGGIALRIATLFRQRVLRLGLINTVSYDSWPIELMIQLGHPAARKKLSAPTAMSMLRFALRKGFVRRPSRELLDGLLNPWRTEVGKLSLIRNAAALNTNLTTELTHLLPTITVPTFILWGEDDRFQPVRYAEWLARDIPGARLIRVANAGHFVMLDQPVTVAKEIRKFLAGNEIQPEETGEIQPANRLRDYLHPAN